MECLTRESQERLSLVCLDLKPLECLTERKPGHRQDCLSLVRFELRPLECRRPTSYRMTVRPTLSRSPRRLFQRPFYNHFLEEEEEEEDESDFD